MKRQNVRTLVLLVSTFLYLLAGAAVFDVLESEHEAKDKISLSGVIDDIQKRYNISSDEMAALQETIIKYVQHKAGVQWKFTGSFFFCMTVITTIGEFVCCLFR